MTLRFTLLASLLVTGPTVAPAHAQGCDAGPVIVRNVSLWTRDGPVAGRDVLFRDGRVAAIEPTRARRDDGVRTIDGTGHTILPGLVDAHLHFSIPGGLPPAAGGAPRTTPTRSRAASCCAPASRRAVCT